MQEIWEQAVGPLRGAVEVSCGNRLTPTRSVMGRRTAGLASASPPGSGAMPSRSRCRPTHAGRACTPIGRRVCSTAGRLFAIISTPSKSRRRRLVSADDVHRAPRPSRLAVGAAHARGRCFGQGLPRLDAERDLISACPAAKGLVSGAAPRSGASASRAQGCAQSQDGQQRCFSPALDRLRQAP